MREVVITGIGIISSLGNNISEVTNSLRNLKSGISENIINKELGLRSHVSGSIRNLEPKDLIDRKLYRFMGDAAAYAYLSTEEAIKDASLNDSELSNQKTGLIMGSGGPSTKSLLRAFDITREKGPKKNRANKCSKSNVQH